MAKRALLVKNTGSALVESDFSQNEVFDQTVRKIPRSAKTRFLKMKDKGLVSGGFEPYIRTALLNQLKIDEGI